MRNFLHRHSIFFLAVFFWCICIFPASTHAAVQVATTTSTVCGDCTSITPLPHTVPAANNRILLVTIETSENGTPIATPTVVTYGGVSLTLVSSASSAAFPERVLYYYYLANPSVGAANVNVTLSGQRTSLIVSASTLTGVNTSSPFRTSTSTNAGNGTTAAIDLFSTSAAGDLVIDAVCHGSGDITGPGVDQTQLFIINDSGDTGCDTLAQSTKAGAASVTTSWTFGFGDTVLAMSVSVKPVVSTLLKPPNNLGLVGYWSFNEGSGTIATDFSGHGLAMVAHSFDSTSWVPGKLGKAVDFDGSVTYLDLATTDTANSSLDLTSAFTLSAWIKPHTFPTAGFYQTFIGKGAAGGNYYFEINGSGPNFDCGFGNASDLVDATGYIVKPEQWQHVVCTFNDAGDTIALYVNGVLVDSSNSITGTPTANNDSLTIGAADAFPNQIVDASVDEVRIYSRALSASEVAKLYQTGAAKLGASTVDLQRGSTLASGLVGYWTFDGADFTNKVIDRSASGKDGYLINMSTTSAKRPGKLGQAITFDGVDDHVVIANSSAVADNLSEMTISTWVKFTADAFGTLLVKSVNSGSPGWSLNISNGGGAGRFSFYTETDGTHYHGRVTASSGYNDGNWHHLVATLTGGGSGTMTMYVDGVSQSLTTDDGLTVTTYSSPSDIWLGDISNSFPYPGSMDDTRIYNRALSPAEVKQLYQLGQVKIKP